MRGQLDLEQVSVLKGLLTASPDNMGIPGLSITLMVVPLGPGFCLITSLRSLANLEFLVAGTVKVVVAPIAQNQVALSAFICCCLSSLDLYKFLPSCSRLVISLSCLAKILLATISLSLVE